MTEVLVLADTHWDFGFVLKALEARPEVRILVHLGDHCADAVRLAAFRNLTLHNVRGNGDGDCEHGCPLEDAFVVEGHRLLLVHGHRFGVKSGLQTLTDYALERDPPVDAVLFGHTHRPYRRLVAKRGRPPLLVLNPGSARRSLLSDADEPSAVLLRISPGVGAEGIEEEWLAPSLLASGSPPVV